MKADRLVATLLFLQRKGTATAAQVAGELEVSERTARRDLNALALAGVPVYSRQGRGGGWSLVGGARTDLSGLTAAETRALFLVAGPSASASKETKAALRKLVQALPEPFRADAEAASQAVIVDPSAWGRTSHPDPPFLDTLQAAVVDGRQVVLEYAKPNSEATSRLVHPLGLVTKRGVWYLVADTDKGGRTFRLDRVRSVDVTDRAVVRPANFDLDEAWQAINVEVARRNTGVLIEAQVDPTMMAPLRATFAGGVRVLGTSPRGWAQVELRTGSVAEGAGRIGGFGAKVKVLGPPEVIEQLRRVGHELRELYDPTGET